MAGKYRVGRSWYLSWVEDGRQERYSLGSVTEAEAETARLAKERSLGIVAAAGPQLCDWAVTYATWHSKEYPDSYFRVEQILRCHLIPAFGHLPLLAIDREAAETYKQRRLTEVSAGTVIKEWRTLQALLNAAVAWEVIPRNPIARVKAPRDLTSRPPRWFTREELALIYAIELEIPRCTTPDDAELHRRFRWSWQLMANTGLRRGEAIQLRWRDIGEEEIGIRSEAHARTKSGKWRSVPLTIGGREAIDALKPAKVERGATVLPPVAPTSVSRAFARTIARAELDGHIHCLRHTFCSHLVQQGIPLRTVQVLAGHASARTTERYAHLAPGAIRAQIAGLAL